jgi:hypothetical protein
LCADQTVVDVALIGRDLRPWCFDESDILSVFGRHCLTAIVSNVATGCIVGAAGGAIALGCGALTGLMLAGSHTSARKLVAAYPSGEGRLATGVER